MKSRSIITSAVELSALRSKGASSYQVSGVRRLGDPPRWRAKCPSLSWLGSRASMVACRRLSQCLSCQLGAYRLHRAIIWLSDRLWFTQDKTSVQSIDRDLLSEW